MSRGARSRRAERRGQAGHVGALRGGSLRFLPRVRRPHAAGRRRDIEARTGFLVTTFPLTSHVIVGDEPTDDVLSGEVPFTTRLGANFTPVAEGTEVDAFLEADPGRFFPVPKFALRKALKLQFDRDIAKLRSHLEALA